MYKPFSIKLINLLFKIISFCLPVKDRVVFLGSPRNSTLMENGQLVYDALKCDKKIIVKPMPHKIKDILYISFFIMTSRVLVIDDHYRYFIYIPLKNNQKLIQMWHGPGAFKKVALDLPNPPKLEKYYHEQYDVFITSSSYVSRYIESGLGISSDKIKALGYPRSEILLNDSDKLVDEFFSKYPEFKNKKIIIYLPTYRRYEEGKLLHHDYNIDWNVLDKFLEKNNAVFLVKRHPIEISNNLNVIPSDCSNVFDLGDSSYFPMMAVSDLLITDYSSVFFDYLLLNKPILFYCPDAEDYLENNGFYLNFPEDLPGYYCTSFDELMNILNDFSGEVDYSKFKERYMGACDGKSTEKIVNLIESYLMG